MSSTADQQCSSSDNESDRELQVAFESGLLSGGLRLPVAKKRQPINNVTALKCSLSHLRNSLSWLERLDVTQPCQLADAQTGVDNDFGRELAFYEQAQRAALDALGRLRKLGVTTDRPQDYFAEMAKTDDHMHKVRARLQTVQGEKIRRERAKDIREQKKYAAMAQKNTLQNRNKDKRELALAVKKHKKGFKDKLNELLGETAEAKARHAETQNRMRNKKRDYKNERFGLGGRKRGLKSNTKNSVDDVDSFSSKFGVKKNKKGKMLKGKPMKGGPKKFTKKQKMQRRRK